MTHVIRPPFQQPAPSSGEPEGLITTFIAPLDDPTGTGLLTLALRPWSALSEPVFLLRFTLDNVSGVS
jgi:hypothetical protein